MSKFLVLLAFIAALVSGGCAVDTDLSPPDQPQIANQSQIEFLNSNEDFGSAIADLRGRGWIVDWTGVRERTHATEGNQHDRVVEVPVHRGPASSAVVGWAGVVESGSVVTAFVNVPSVVTNNTSGTSAASGNSEGTSTSRQAAIITTATCAPYFCDYPTAISWAWYCVNPDNNPVGYALRRVVRRGYSTCNSTRYGWISNPSWYANRCGQTVVCPGVQQSVSTYLQCVAADGSSDFCS